LKCQAGITADIHLDNITPRSLLQQLLQSVYR